MYIHTYKQVLKSKLSSGGSAVQEDSAGEDVSHRDVGDDGCEAGGGGGQGGG